MLNVLIVSGGSFQGTTLLRGLEASTEIKIFLADCYDENINKYETGLFYQVSKIQDSENFLCDLEKIIESGNIELIFPSTSYELHILSENKERLKRKNIQIAVSDIDLLKILLDKKKTHRFLSENGIPVPKSVKKIDETSKYPIIGKLRDGFGGKGITVFKSLDEREQYPDLQIENYHWEKYYTQFDEFSTDFAIGFDGAISPLILRKRIKTSGGYAVITESADDEQVKNIANNVAKLLKSKGGVGLFNVQALKTDDGNIVISDVNPRVGTSSIFSLGEGVNLPLFVCSTIHREINWNSSQWFKKPVKMVRNLNERWVPVNCHKDVKGIVFDLDDTLIDQKKWIIDKLCGLHEKLPSLLPPKDEFLRTALWVLEEGNRAKLIDGVIEKLDLSLDIRSQMIEAYRESVPPGIKVYPDVDIILKKLKKANFKLVLLTDNPVKSQQQKIDQTNFRVLFDQVVYSRAIGGEKPDQGVFRYISELIGVNASNLAMVGDNLYRDIWGALQAGFSYGFFIDRPQTVYNFNYHSFLSLLEEDKARRVIRIKHLNDLYYSMFS